MNEISGNKGCADEKRKRVISKKEQLLYFVYIYTKRIECTKTTC